MFFDNFPYTFFKLDATNQVIVTDFITAIKLDPQLKTDTLLFDIYEAKDNETPEIISHKAYKSTEYGWVIMLVNEKFDPHRDYPKSDDLLVAYAQATYANIDAVHHYEDMNGNWVDNITTSGNPITNMEYVRNQNEATRTIKLLKQEVLSEFVQQYKNLLST